MAKHAQKRRPLSRVLTLVVLAALIALFLRWSNTSLQTTYFDSVFTALPEGFDGCRIAVLGDLHSTDFGKGNSRLLKAVREAEPDYIFLVGDLLDAYRDIPENYIFQTAGGLAAIAPTYYVTGTTNGPTAACRS